MARTMTTGTAPAMGRLLAQLSFARRQWLKAGAAAKLDGDPAARAIHDTVNYKLLEVAAGVRALAGVPFSQRLPLDGRPASRRAGTDRAIAKVDKRLKDGHEQLVDTLGSLGDCTGEGFHLVVNGTADIRTAVNREADLVEDLRVQTAARMDLLDKHLAEANLVTEELRSDVERGAGIVDDLRVQLGARMASLETQIEENSRMQNEALELLDSVSREFLALRVAAEGAGLASPADLVHSGLRADAAAFVPLGGCVAAAPGVADALGGGSASALIVRTLPCTVRDAKDLSATVFVEVRARVAAVDEALAVVDPIQACDALVTASVMQALAVASFCSTQTSLLDAVQAPLTSTHFTEELSRSLHQQAALEFISLTVGDVKPSEDLEKVMRKEDDIASAKVKEQLATVPLDAAMERQGREHKPEAENKGHQLNDLTGGGGNQPEIPVMTRMPATPPMFSDVVKDWPASSTQPPDLLSMASAPGALTPEKTARWRLHRMVPDFGEPDEAPSNSHQASPRNRVRGKKICK